MTHIELLRQVLGNPEQKRIARTDFNMSDKAVDYIQSIRNPPQYSPPTYNEAKIKFLEIYDTAITATGKQTVIDDELGKILPNLIRWFLDHGIYEPKKGLFLVGSTGRSKTMIMKSLQKMASFYKMPKQFDFCSAPTIFDSCQFDRDFQLSRYHFNNLLIDDVGFSEPQIQSFGNTIRPIESILRTRYNRFISEGQITHITTNLSLPQLKEHFDARMIDRFKEMFTIVPFKGESFRK